MPCTRTPVMWPPPQLLDQVQTIADLLVMNHKLHEVAPGSPWTSPKIAPILGEEMLKDTAWGREYPS